MKRFILDTLIKINMLRKWLRSFLPRPTTLIATMFHKQYYLHHEKRLHNTRWLGTKIIKPPFDMWVYQEIIWETRPDLIIEAGTLDGGSASFLASICDLISHGRIISIDITTNPYRPLHPRITYVTGSSTDDQTVSKIKANIGTGEKVIVILDSNHRRHHVLKEMEIYGPLVSPGYYMIVEDTHLNGHPVHSSYGPGPMEAVKIFMKSHPEFNIDKTREKFLFSFNYGGYLKKSR